MGAWTADDSAPEGGAASPAARPPAAKPGTGPAVRWLLSLSIAGLFFLVGYLIAAQWLFPGAGRASEDALVQVPELVGLTETEARGRLERVGLEYTVRAGVSHYQAPEGAILAQNPLPGQYARPGAPVFVTLSRGPERYVLPDVAGLSARQATIVLERLGFTVRTESETHTMDAGRAVATRPEAGVELAVPAEIVLVVSEGRPVVGVPDLAGRHVDDAAGLLGDAGLQLGAITYDATASEAPGRIIGQYPPAGYSLRQGGLVEVRVAGDVARVDRTRDWFERRRRNP